jgi:hypothetical protein
MMVAESKGEEIKACCRGRREKGSFRNKMMVAERERKEIKPCCRGGREKGSFKTKETNDGR